MDHARSSRPYLELDVFERNSGARRFYERYGFVPLGTRVHEPTGEIQLRLRLD
jgi:putative acetyltransferase